jgi:nitric oxide reductase subunit C
MDVHGFPAKPTWLPVAVPDAATGQVVASPGRPKILNQMGLACHTMAGQGGVVGPVLDGVGDRRSYDNLVAWITDPQQLTPGTAMPQLPLTQADVVALASLLSHMQPLAILRPLWDTLGHAIPRLWQPAATCWGSCLSELWIGDPPAG